MPIKEEKSLFLEVSCLRFLTKKLAMLSALLVFCAGIAAATQQTTAAKSKKSTKHAHHPGKRKPAKTSWKKKGQQGITSERATEIQQALIKQNYLTGDPSGTWDARTQAAMVKFQGDNGWQTKEIPDSRAIIKLGLGPDYSSQTLINSVPKTPANGAPGTTTAARGPVAEGDKQ
jgi:hypothetical protein